jgi:hypothetical protein
MPYALQKQRNTGKFWVKNKDTGRKLSKKPMPFQRAKKQLAAVLINTRGKGRTQVLKK